MTKSPILGCLLLLLATSSVPAQVLRPNENALEAMEKYDDAPALVWRTGVSPRMVSQLGPYTSYQVNVSANGLNITGDAANEAGTRGRPT